MDTALLDVLRCPACRLPLQPDGALAAGGDAGRLTCSECRAEYPVQDGVPRLVRGAGVVARTRRGFDHQWFARHSGRAEARGSIYGYDIHGLMAWVDGTFTAGLRAASPGSWLLDAGCGSGEKSRELALAHPGHQVVAVDQSASISLAARRNRDVENLHFVQADVWELPFADAAFAFAMSIGVIHHTPDTRRAFASLARVVAPGGDLMTWIYPLPEEDTFWAGLYRQRDRHFLGLGRRLPPPVTMALSKVYVLVGYRWLKRWAKRQRVLLHGVFPDSLYPAHPSRRQLYESAVFLTFDNVMPVHQFRHGRREVASWYRDHGFGEVDDRYPGFFHATRSAVPAGT